MPESLISARGLTKKFGDFTAVDAIDFDVAKGESFGLLGPKGAGKSTTMRIIAATSQRTSGTITVLDRDPEEHGPQIRAHLGYFGVLLIAFAVLILNKFQVIPKWFHVGVELGFDITGQVANVFVAQRNNGPCQINLLILTLLFECRSKGNQRFACACHPLLS